MEYSITYAVRPIFPKDLKSQYSKTVLLRFDTIKNKSGVILKEHDHALKVFNNTKLLDEIKEDFVNFFNNTFIESNWSASAAASYLVYDRLDLHLTKNDNLLYKLFMFDRHIESLRSFESNTDYSFMFRNF